MPDKKTKDMLELIFDHAKNNAEIKKKTKK